MKTWKFPNALVIILGFVLLAGILTFIIPKGKYERITDPATNREVVVPGSYKTVEADQLSFFQIAVSIPKGIASGVEVVVLIFLIGGCIYIVEKTGALKDGILLLATKVNGKEELALIGIGFAFSIGGALEGLQEEMIPLIPVLLMLTKRLGYNAFVTIAISYGSSVIGATFSPVNPFGAVTAQKIAEVPFLSGAMFRVIIFILAFVVWVTLIIRYGNRNRIEKEVTDNEQRAISGKSVVILILFLIAFIILVIGLMKWNWGFNEMSAEFFLMGIVIGLVGKLGINGTCVAYAEGFKEMSFAALIVGFAYSIKVVLQEGMIIDSIIYGLFTPLQHLPSGLSAFGMMASQAFLHVIIPSYSGQAVLTIPILAPLSDLLGISRQVCVLAFQYGAILTDIIIPTNGALMAMLALAGISYDQWFGFVLKRMLIIFALGAGAILLAGFIGL
jgi:uncharacterized ion transporter superfamily protein YfcC